MADHVGIGKVHHNEIELPRRDGCHQLVGDFIGGHFRLQVIGRDVRRWHQNALFAGRKRWTSLVVPWCTYTDPEVAHVGSTSGEVIEQRMENVDRAILDDATEGLLKLYLSKDRIVGATLVASHAGETISELTLAVTDRRQIQSLAQTIHCYPTQAEIIKKAADAYNRTRLTPRVKKWLGRWLNWSRS